MCPQALTAKLTRSQSSFDTSLRNNNQVCHIWTTRSNADPQRQERARLLCGPWAELLLWVIFSPGNFVLTYEQQMRNICISGLLWACACCLTTQDHKHALSRWVYACKHTYECEGRDVQEGVWVWLVRTGPPFSFYNFSSAVWFWTSLFSHSRSQFPPVKWR